MLDKVECIFDKMVPMLKKVKKKNYEQRMNDFREEYGHYIQEMIEYVENQEDKETAVGTIADVFVDKVKQSAQVNGKIGGRKQADMNFFMIYYVFPAILLTEHEEADNIAGAICKKWGATFKDSNIGYTTFEKLNESFRNKIFGIF